MTVWFSKENYMFLKENYGGRVSEIMDAFATFLRTGNVTEVSVLRIGGYEWVRPDSNRGPPACEAGVMTARPRTPVNGLLDARF